MSVDLHCHTKLSDSSMGIDDLIVLAKAKNVTTISITDHDCQAGNVRGKIIGERRGVTVIPGVELSSFDSARNKRADLLCYLSDSPDRLEGLCHRNISSRKRASQIMVLKVAQRYPITAELVVKCASGSTAIFVEHIMHALMECGLTDSMHGPMYDELFSPESRDAVFVQPKFPEPAEVLTAIHEAGGVAILAHPYKPNNLEALDKLIALGLDGIEVWHPGHSTEQVTQLQALAQEKGLLMTGGSNFHGMYGKGVSIGDVTTPEDALKALLSYKAQLRKNANRA